MKKKLFILTLFIFISSNLQSQDKEILVTSSKLINNQLIGGSTEIITREEIGSYPGESIAQIISRLPGVEYKSLYGNGFGSYEDIDIRGFADTAKSNTIILLNGHKLSNIDSGFVDYSTIPINSIERIEVIRGNSASVLYGGNASAGAINIITDQLPSSEDRYFASTTFGSYGKFEGFLSGSKSFNNFSINGSSSYASADGYRRNNGLRKKNGSLEIESILNENLSTHLNISYFDNLVELPGDVPVYAYSAGSLNGLNGFEIDPRSTDTPRDFATKYGYKIFTNSVFLLNNNSELINDISFRSNKSQGFFFQSSAKVIDSYMDVISFNPKIKFKNKFFGFNQNSIAGLDSSYTYYRSDRMASDGGDTMQVYKFTDANLGLYYNSETKINKTNQIGLGIRVQGNWLRASDYVGPVSGASMTSNANSLSYDPQFAFHIGYEKDLINYGVIYSRVGRSFSYPNVDQRVGQASYGVSHDFKLRTQVSNDIEIGHKVKLKNLRINHSIYYMNLRAELYYDSVDFINKNLDPTKRYGFESSIHYKILPKINLSNSFALTKAKLRSGQYDGNEIPGVPSLTNNFEVNFDLLDDIKFFTNLYYRGSTRMINDTKNFQVKIAEYYLLNSGLKGSFKGFDFSLSANNILDKSYYNYAVGSASTYNAYNVYPLPEFNVLFKLSRTF